MTAQLDIPASLAAQAEAKFAAKVRAALDESAAALPHDKLDRLAAARKAALRAQKPEARAAQTVRPHALAGAGQGSTINSGAPYGRFGLALAIWFVGSVPVGIAIGKYLHRRA